MNDNKPTKNNPIVEAVVTIIAIVFLLLWVMSWFEGGGAGCSPADLCG